MTLQTAKKTHIIKVAVSDLHFVKISVKQLHILTAITDNSLVSNVSLKVSPFCSKLKIHFWNPLSWLDENGSGTPENVFSVHDRAEDSRYWQNTRTSDACLSVELLNAY